MRFVSWLLILLVLSSCATAAKNFDSAYVEQYQARPSLEKSLLNNEGRLSEADIEHMLATKVKLPASLSLAVVRLPGLGADSQNLITQEDAQGLLNRASWGRRVQAIIPLPEMLLSKEPNLRDLRQAAALVQADALVVIKPVATADWRFNWFNSDEAKAISTLEVLLVDVRTSAIPFTALVSEQVEVDENSGDYSKPELLRRARKLSEVKAARKIPQEVKSYLEKVL